MRAHPTTKADEEARLAVVNAMRPWADELGAERMLAILAYATGQMMALQDQTKMTPDRALVIIGSNIELGNKDVIDGLLGKTSGNA